MNPSLHCLLRRLNCFQNSQLLRCHPMNCSAMSDATKRGKMLFSLTATLTITYGPATHQCATKQARSPVKLTTHHKFQPHLVDHMEKSLSPETLAMQRCVREKRRQERDAKPTGSANTSVEKAEAATAESDISAIAAHSWERLSLAEAQLVDLQAMDLTDLSAALLEHPRGTGVEYTEQDIKILRVLFERKVSRRQQRT
jgi:hypothetical protein